MLVFIGFSNDMRVAEMTECIPNRLNVLNMIHESLYDVCAVVDVEDYQMSVWMEDDYRTVGEDVADLDMCGMVIAKMDSRNL